MRTTHSRGAPLAGLCAAVTARTFTAPGAPAVDTGVASAASSSSAAPIVRVADGAVRGADVSGGYEFLGLPYAAPPTGNLRWRPPRRPTAWNGLRDATRFAPSCPQAASLFAPPARRSGPSMPLFMPRGLRTGAVSRSCRARRSNGPLP